MFGYGCAVGVLITTSVFFLHNAKKPTEIIQKSCAISRINSNKARTTVQCFRPLYSNTSAHSAIHLVRVFEHKNTNRTGRFSLSAFHHHSPAAIHIAVLHGWMGGSAFNDNSKNNTENGSACDSNTLHFQSCDLKTFGFQTGGFRTQFLQPGGALLCHHERLYHPPAYVTILKSIRSIDN